ncbi:MAG: lipoate protein ligase C-terminal domain-containing protein [Anaerolineaceae bacterium]|jgi:lipoate-protein ligase A|nr:lipoate protein ligase C-terminal domain-containing protein [Anaerolineaceae bacterium]
MKTNSITRKFGKMLRLDVIYSEKIESLKITGDFFLHPEETLDQISEELTGVAVPIQKELLFRKIKYIMDSNEAEMIGITLEDILNTLDEATQ